MSPQILLRRSSRRRRPPQQLLNHVDDVAPFLSSESKSTSSSNSSSNNNGNENTTTKTTSFFTLSVGCPKKYANKRTMTPLQEKINALTILPSGIYCIHYLWTGKWIRPETWEWAAGAAAAEAATAAAASTHYHDTTITTSGTMYDCTSHRSFLYSAFPYLPPIPIPPPTTILAICVGILLHCPCSFLYHWKYAAANPKNATERFQHWSRRLDHSAIHLCSMFWAYGLSGTSPIIAANSSSNSSFNSSTDHVDAAESSNTFLFWICFVVLNVVYNTDSIRCHWETEIQPRRNQIRILISMILYTSPLLWQQHHHHQQQQQLLLFGKIWILFGIALWFFATYPIGGWSHAAFHIIMVGVPPLLLEYVAELETQHHHHEGMIWSREVAYCTTILSSSSRR